MVWRAKLVAELEPGLTTEVEFARLERDEHAGLAVLGLRLADAKQLTAAVQAEMVAAQVTKVGERPVRAWRVNVSRPARVITPRRCALFGDVPLRVRRLLTCPSQGSGAAKSSGVLKLDAATVVPELAYVTARYAALAASGKVAALLPELLPISGTQNAGTVRNRTLRVGEDVVQAHAVKTTEPITAQAAEPVTAHGGPAGIVVTFDQGGEFAAAVELRRRFPCIRRQHARDCARSIARWTPLNLPGRPLVRFGKRRRSSED